MERELIAVQSVKDMQAVEKRCLEGLLGQQLSDRQQVFILAFTPDLVPDESTRRQALTEIKSLQAKAETYANANGIGEEEIDAALEEAMRHVRPRKA